LLIVLPQVKAGRVRPIAAAGTPGQFHAFIRAEIDKWAKVVKTANMKAD